MLRVAVIGCGKIADSHAAQIRRVSRCEIVAACDTEPLMARQFCERFSIPKSYSDVEELLRDSRPDVVHITTPPRSHYSLGMLCLDAGCHVYMEKPFTVDEGEARLLVDCAVRSGMSITVGHDHQFRHAARRLRALVERGFLGDGPVHMESHYGYELGRAGYAGALLGDKNHWVRSLPGGLIQNIISHGIARIAEFLPDDQPEVRAIGFTSRQLKAQGEVSLVDELRVFIKSDDGTTAYFTFSSQMRPSLHEFRIFGTKNGIAMDQDQETLVELRGTKRQSYLEQMVSPLQLAKQYVGNAAGNMRKFLHRDFHPKAGMKCLIEKFYESIEGNGPLPISHREILLTSHIMDRIISQIGDGSAIAKSSAHVV